MKLKARFLVQRPSVESETAVSLRWSYFLGSWSPTQCLLFGVLWSPFEGSCSWLVVSRGPSLHDTPGTTDVHLGVAACLPV